MIIIFLITFVITVLLNWYIILFGNKDLEQLKNKMSIQKYLREIEQSLVTEFGDKVTTWLKIGLIVLCIAIVIFNAFLFIGLLLGIILGTFLAKKSFKIGSLSNVLNKIATYINRVR